MRNSWITVGGLLFSILVGCTSNDQPDVPNIDAAIQLIKSEKQQAIERYIDRTHKTTTRGSEIPLLPYIVDGDTVMFVANYPDGGFEIFSNDLALPMVLVKSKTGAYNPYGKIVKTPFDEFLAEAGETIAENQSTNNNIDADITWSVYSNREEERNEGGESYVGTGCEVVEREYTPKGGRLATKWNQDYPYNQFTPLCSDGSGEHSLVGCGAVAVGQFLYHYNKYFKIPATTVTSATYNSSTNTYSFTGTSSTIWNSFINSSNNAVAAKQTAIFLGYVAKEIYTDFGRTPSEGSSTESWSYPWFINSECGSKYAWKQFSISNVLEVFQSGHPVITTSRLNQYKNDGTVVYNSGHAYLIDYTSTIQVTYYDVYAEKRNDDDIDDKEDHEDDYAYGPSMDYFYKKYKNVSTSFAGRETENWISMNWGWGGMYDDLLINAQLSTWDIYRSKDKLLLYNTDILM
ncbi:MAG: C10 family peptidase [Muribaculaceae bacterium]|nr:C10 family peptidase [Muribaculaceae bacterium]